MVDNNKQGRDSAQPGERLNFAGGPKIWPESRRLSLPTLVRAIVASRHNSEKPLTPFLTLAALWAALSFPAGAVSPGTAQPERIEIGCLAAAPHVELFRAVEAGRGVKLASRGGGVG